MALCEAKFVIAVDPVPLAPQRAVMASAIKSVIPGCEVTWDVSGVSQPSVTIGFETLAGNGMDYLSRMVHAFNTAYIHVDGWPPFLQTCGHPDMPGPSITPASSTVVALIELSIT